MADVDEEKDFDLIDAGRNKKIAGRKLETTALNHFNKFLVHINHRCNKFG